MKAAVALASLAPAAVLASGGLAVPKPRVERARSGDVAAAFSYALGGPRPAGFSRQRLVIRRAGVTRFAARLRKPPPPAGQAQPANYFEHRRSVSVRDLDGDGEPEIVLDLYWGGAHCCWYTQVYRYLPSETTYRALVHVWGNVRYRLVDLNRNGVPELVTRDDRFSYAFASFAYSQRPLRILEYSRGQLTVVTRSFPREIAADANALWREAASRAGRRENCGILAAWAAEESMLGRGREALHTLERLRRQGRLHGSDEPPRAYLAHLRRFLVRTGYR